MKGHYENLLDKLDKFVRKYYVNELIKGGLYTISLGVLCFLLFALAEHFFYFDPNIRKVLMWSFLGLTAFMLYRWIGLPLTKYFKLGRRISHEQAASIIGEHFTDVQDKLLNVLQLKKSSDPDNSLAMASIERKTAQIAPIKFQKAIDLTNNKRYLPYAIPPLMILIALLVAAPTLITDSTHRIIHNNEVFEKAAPFHFSIENEALSVPQYDDYTLNVKVEGDLLPKQVYIDVNGFQYRMKAVAKDHYRYTFKNVQQEQAFFMEAENVKSNASTLEVILKPSILSMEAAIDYPAYTGQRDERRDNVGDIVIPEGSKIKWLVEAENTSELTYAFGSNAHKSLELDRNGRYSFEKRIRNNTNYKLQLGNESLPKNDSVEYSIQVIKDQYPNISLQQFVDSSDLNNLYLAGTVSDDYGISKLFFQYEILDELNKQKVQETSQLEVKRNSKTQAYDYVFNVDSLKLDAGDQLIYFFEVFDNDGVNGAKSTKSDIKQLRKPTEEEFEDKEEQNEDEINKALAEAKKKSDEINKDLKDLKDKLIQEKEMSWQMKQDLENLMDRQQQLNEEVQQAEEKFKENLENQEEFSEPSEALKEKQEKLQELFEEMQDPKAQELMEKINELMQELDRESTLEMLEQMDLEEMEFNMDLDRLQELFKQLELERDMMQQTERLEELAKEQQELSEETQEQNGEEKSDQEQAELEEQQEEINEEFEEIQEELEKLQERNEALESPKSMEDPSDKTEDIENDLQESLEQLEQQQNNQASESQQNASEKMQELASELQQQMQAGQMEQMQEDMKSMRQLLENLIGLSFEQEALIEDVRRTKKQTPKFTELVQQQYKLKGDFGLIEDSLQALSKRVVEIESFILEKVTEINGQMDKGLKMLEERKKGDASNQQRRIMKNTNDLALMFEESMQNMQQQMAQQMPGQQACEKPGQGKPKPGQGSKPMDKITQGQKELNGDMQKMKEGTEKEGEEGQGSSEEFAKMAARQSALRQALQEKIKELQSKGKGSKELQDLANEMDKIETDLVNKRLTNEMLLRQKDIVTRLLEAENAEREQEFEEKRQSKTAEELAKEIPPAYQEYLKVREAQIEPFQNVSPALKAYYKKLVDAYYSSLKKG